jgi:hypothetical protein
LLPQFVPLLFGVLTQPFTGSHVAALHASTRDVQLHAEQALLPAELEYVPVGQGLHWLAPAVAYEPSGHATQALAELAPVVADADPAGQGVHVMLPAFELKVPAGHGVQALTLPPVEYEPAEHGLQMAWPVWS